MGNWDYIVIGAGSAGCAAAYELARGGQASVLLLEAGGSDKSPYIRIPALVVQACRKFDWHYKSKPDSSREGRIDDWTRGRVLGGTSSINGMMFVRGAAQDFDQWAALGNEGWAYADVAPLYRDMETADQPGVLRGREGPLRVRTVKGAHRLTEAFMASAVNAGVCVNADYNGRSQEGVGYAQLTQRRGLRCSSADAFVSPLANNSHFKLQLNTLVTRIDFAEGKAIGVTCVRGGKTQSIGAQRVILCAGAINSPKLLMLSGIGDESALRALGIEPNVHRPEVGRNLQEHPLIRLVYGTTVPSNNLTGGVPQCLDFAKQFLLRRQGPISTLFEAAAFIKTSTECLSPDIQLHFIPYGVLSIEKAAPRLKVPAISVYVNKSHPQSRGTIRLGSADPLGAPQIDCKLLESPEDLATLIRGIRIVRDIMRASPIRDLIREEIAPGAANLSDEDLVRYARAHTEIAYHPVGTCRMGIDDGAVVTPDLQVRALENLWVADASVMPSHISGNTNAACIMIGMKLGRQLNPIKSLKQLS